MIFVTVGTHEQPFNRLIQKIDELICDKTITDEVFMQIGYSTYEPKYAFWSRVISYEEMSKYENEAEIIITHGGAATFMSALAKGKTPIVVPRLEKFNEHVNDHQMDFAKKVKELGYNILIVEDINPLGDMINLSKYNQKAIASNTSYFTHAFKYIVNDLIEGKRQ